MPKQTFFNLPQEKRDSIINAAVEEFAEFGLENASTNRIVKNSGIAKGSFYQYFEDKLDVFMYLLDVVEKMEMDYYRFLSSRKFICWHVTGNAFFTCAYGAGAEPPHAIKFKLEIEGV